MAEQKRRDRMKRAKQKERNKMYKAIGRRRLADMIRAHKIPATIGSPKEKS